MPIKYIYLFIFFTSCIWAGQAQVEKELLLTFKQGGSELDIAAKNKIEKTLQSFAPNTPIEVVFYQDASAQH